MNHISRREALAGIGVAGMTLSAPALGNTITGQRVDAIKLGVITDTHIGFVDNAEARLDSFIEAMGERSLDGLAQLGDFAFPNEEYRDAPSKLNQAHGEVLHVIGNHDLDLGLTKQHCIDEWGIPARFYRKDIGSIRVLVLDGNDRGSPSHRGGYPTFVGPEQVEWLEGELSEADRPILVLSHQPLAGRASIDNAEQLQELFGKHAEKIILCVNGHTHVDSLVEVQGVRFLHVNSASYFWMGGDVRMAHYDDPLFTQLTIDPESQTVRVEGRRSDWSGVSPEEAGYFDGKDESVREMVTPQIRARTIASN